jgi:hypothetical protein
MANQIARVGHAQRGRTGSVRVIKSKKMSGAYRRHTKSVLGGKVSILGGHSIGHSKQKTLYEHVSYSERFPR